MHETKDKLSHVFVLKSSSKVFGTTMQHMISSLSAASIVTSISFVVCCKLLKSLFPSMPDRLCCVQVTNCSLIEAQFQLKHKLISFFFGDFDQEHNLNGDTSQSVR